LLKNVLIVVRVSVLMLRFVNIAGQHLLKVMQWENEQPSNTICHLHLPPTQIAVYNVLGCFGMNGGHLKQKDGTILDTYIESLKSIYYDFQNQKWKNDLYGQRAEPIFVTHWMPLPAIGSSDWIPVILHIPDVAGLKGFSI
jgi:hypothetical protein